MNTGRVFCHASFSPFGGSGSLRNASSLPTSRRPRASRRRLGAHRARDALRRAEQVAEHRDRAPAGAAKAPSGCSNSSAGPPAFSTRSQISVISRLRIDCARATRQARRGARAARGSRAGRDRPSGRIDVQYARRRDGNVRRAGSAPYESRMTCRDDPLRRSRARSSARAASSSASRSRASCCRSSTARRPPRSPASSRARSRSTARSLGTLAATYFYVYTVLQVPVGVLADTLGPRRILSGRLARRGRRLARVRARADLGGRRRSAARSSASACRSRSSRS